MEATFNPSETIQSLVDLLNKVIVQPEKPFDLCKHVISCNFNLSHKCWNLILLRAELKRITCAFYYADTTTPKKKLIKDVSQDFYTAGFCPGAIVYFSYDVSKGEFLVWEGLFSRNVSLCDFIVWFMIHVQLFMSI